MPAPGAARKQARRSTPSLNRRRPLMQVAHRNSPFADQPAADQAAAESDAYGRNWRRDRFLRRPIGPPLATALDLACRCDSFDRGGRRVTVLARRARGRPLPHLANVGRRSSPFLADRRATRASESRAQRPNTDACARGRREAGPPGDTEGTACARRALPRGIGCRLEPAAVDIRGSFAPPRVRGPATPCGGCCDDKPTRPRRRPRPYSARKADDIGRRVSHRGCGSRRPAPASEAVAASRKKPAAIRRVRCAFAAQIAALQMRVDAVGAHSAAQTERSPETNSRQNSTRLGIVSTRSRPSSQRRRPISSRAAEGRARNGPFPAIARERASSWRNR